MDPILPMEKLLVQRLFGKNMVLTNITHSMVSFPIAIFCNRRRNQNFVGENIDGFAVKFCNDFFPAPTDVGICMSKNLAIKNVINYDLNEDYVWYMASDKQIPSSKIGMNSFWAGNEFVLLNNAFDAENYDDTMTVRTLHKDNYLSLQIHPANELAEILHKDKRDKRTTSGSLEPGYQYKILVSPKIQKSSNTFNDVSLDKRQCLLDHEMPEGYDFKTYSKSNCLYQCFVSMA